jgi:hypothetical protein
MDLSDSRIQQTVEKVLQAKKSAADLMGGPGGAKSSVRMQKTWNGRWIA